MSYDFDHSIIELIVADFIIVVAVDLRHDLIPDQVIALFERCLAESSVEDLTQLIFAYHTVAILVEDAKGNAEVLTVEQASSIDRCSDEFTVVNLAVLVRIELADQIIPVLRARFHGSKDLAHPLR